MAEILALALIIWTTCNRKLN